MDELLSVPSALAPSTSVCTVPVPLAPSKRPVPPNACQVPSSKAPHALPEVVRNSVPLLVLILTALWSAGQPAI